MGLAKAYVVLTGLATALGALAFTSHFTLFAMAFSGPTDDLEPMAWYFFAGVFGFGAMAGLTGLVALAIIIVWSWRAMASLEARGFDGQWRGGWTVGAWLIPYANYVLPILLLCELWKASHAGALEGWRQQRAPTKLIAAWIAFFGVFFLAMPLYFLGVVSGIAFELPRLVPSALFLAFLVAGFAWPLYQLAVHVLEISRRLELASHPAMPRQTATIETGGQTL